MDIFNKRLRDEVIALRKSIDAIRDEYKSQHENKNQQTPQPVVVQAELQIPEATERDHGTRDDRAHRQQVWLTVGTWLAFIAAAIYAGIAARQLHQMRRTNELAAQANEQTLKIANRQFEFGKEQLNFMQAADVRVSGGVGVFAIPGDNVTIDVVNFGHEPATKITITLEITKRYTKGERILGKVLHKVIYPHDLVAVQDATGGIEMTSSNRDSQQIGVEFSANEIHQMIEGNIFVQAKGIISYNNGVEIVPHDICLRRMTFIAADPRDVNPPNPGGPFVQCGNPFDFQKANALRIKAGFSKKQ
jgi:hypothetical protein